MDTYNKRAGARKSWQRELTAFAFATVVLGIPTAGRATESGLGRPLTGMQIAPYMGIVPPTSDWIFSVSTIYYEGSLGKTKTIPIAGTVSAGLNYHIEYTILNAVKTWGITAGGWNFASSFGVPFQYTSISSFNGRLPNDSGTQFTDIFFTPVVAGYHLTKTDHIALSVQMYAPTGAYNVNRLANPGLNTWTFIPTVAYTKLLPEHNIELSANYGVEFYTANALSQRTAQRARPACTQTLYRRMGCWCGRWLDSAARPRHRRPCRGDRRYRRPLSRDRPDGNLVREAEQHTCVGIVAMGQ